MVIMVMVLVLVVVVVVVVLAMGVIVVWMMMQRGGKDNLFGLRSRRMMRRRPLGQRRRR